MRGDEVDRRPRAPSAAGSATEQVLRAGQSGRELAHPRSAAPEVAHGVAEPVVPLRPGGAEPAQRVALARGVPRLGEELALPEHRVGLDRGQQRCRRVEPAAAGPAQHRGEVEPETVHAQVLRPVAQRIGDHPHRRERAGVDRVAAAGQVHPVEVVGARRQAAPGQRQRMVRAALAGVVVDHVQHHLDPGLVQRIDHRRELVQLRTRPARISGVRREVAQGRVAPVVRPAGGRQQRFRGVRLHRQQLQRGHVQPAQMVDDRRMRHPGEAAAQLRRHPGMLLGQSLHVRLVDDGVLPRHVRARGAGPHRRRDDAQRRAVRGVGPRGGGRDQVVVGRVHPPRVRVEQHLGAVVRGDAIAVALARLDARHERVPDAVGHLRHRQPAFLAGRVEQTQLDGGGAGGPRRGIPQVPVGEAVGDHREVGAAADDGGAQRKWAPRERARGGRRAGGGRGAHEHRL